MVLTTELLGIRNSLAEKKELKAKKAIEEDRFPELKKEFFDAYYHSGTTARV